MIFLNQITDGIFKHMIDVQNALCQGSTLIKNYYQRTQFSIDKGWPENIHTALNATARDFDKNLQGRQRSQKYIDFPEK